MVETVECKLRVGRIRKLGKLHYVDGRIYFEFGFWRALNEEIKKMEGRKYHGYDKVNPRKWWSAPDTPRNRFALAYLQEKNPYALYDAPLIEVTTERPLYKHQIVMMQHALTRRQCIFACEMGVGKTLAAIEVMETVFRPEYDDSKIIKFPYWAHPYVWYVSTIPGLKAVRREFNKWDAFLAPEYMTYEGLAKRINNWPADLQAPRMVIFDESSKIKTPTALRSQAAYELANGIRDDWGDEAYIIEMSGSPAPKSPADWWHQCEVACPGFLAEGNIHLFKQRLAVIDERENPVTGGKYPHLIGWRDGIICDQCGEPEDSPQHSIVHEDYHAYVRSKDELDALYKRMKGLVLVQFKKDCLDLPEKQYRVIDVMPEPDTLRTARAIAETAPTAIKALTLLRELSDGFQYVEEKTGNMIVCQNCHGQGEVDAPFDPDNEESPFDVQLQHSDDVKIKCPVCNGKKEIPETRRVAREVPCPKIDVVKDLLGEHEDVGRFIIYAAFTGSIDRVTRVCLQQHWSVIRVDGRGWHWINPDNTAAGAEHLEIFQDQLVKHKRVVFVGHPGSAGIGLTLTASPSIFYYSNSFKAEDRIQSEDRIHRPGMDDNRGATIIDCEHLPTDRYVTDNVRAKRDLQSATLGEIRDALAG